jgi:hypothetical protein
MCGQEYDYLSEIMSYNYPSSINAELLEKTGIVSTIFINKEPAPPITKEDILKLRELLLSGSFKWQ